MLTVTCTDGKNYPSDEIMDIGGELRPKIWHQENRFWLQYLLESDDNNSLQGFGLYGIWLERIFDNRQLLRANEEKDFNWKNEKLEAQITVVTTFVDPTFKLYPHLSVFEDFSFGVLKHFDPLIHSRILHGGKAITESRVETFKSAKNLRRLIFAESLNRRFVMPHEIYVDLHHILYTYA